MDIEFDIAPNAWKVKEIRNLIIKVGVMALAVWTGFDKNRDPVARGLLVGLVALVLVLVLAQVLGRLDRILVGGGGVTITKRGRQAHLAWDDLTAARLSLYGAFTVTWRFTFRDGRRVTLPYLGMNHEDWSRLSKAIIANAAAAGVSIHVGRYAAWIFDLKDILPAKAQA